MPQEIAYCVPEFPTQTHIFFWREIQAITKNGIRLVLVSTRRPDRNLCPHDFADEARQFTHYLFPPRITAIKWVLRHPLRVAKAAHYVMSLEETSVVNRFKLLPLILCAADLVKLCRSRGAKHIHIHSFATSAFLGPLSNILDDLTFSLTLHGDLPVYGVDHEHKVRNAAFVTAVTSPLATQINSVMPGLNPIVVPMGVDVDKFRPSERPRARQWIHIVSVARLNAAKGHLYFLEAMSRLVKQGIDLRYSVAGIGPFREQIEDRIAQLGLSERVVLLGALGEREIVPLLQDSDIFALCSYGQGEAAPVAVMEAMACGLPVVCSRIGGTCDMIIDGLDGVLVDQKDVDGIADAVCKLANDGELRMRIGAAARSSALKKFDYRTRAIELCNLFKALP